MDNSNTYSHGGHQQTAEYYPTGYDGTTQYGNASVGQPLGQEDLAVPQDFSSSTPLRLQESSQPLSGVSSGSYFGHGDQNDVEDYEDSLDYAPPAKALALQTLTTLSTIVFTVLPVVIKAGADATWGHWYSWRDGCRLIEPFCSGLLHTWFFYSSDLMSRYPSETEILAQRRQQRRAARGLQGGAGQSPKYANGNGPSPAFAPSPSRSPLFKSTLSTVFTFFLILYVTGAGIHTAAAFFKNIIVLFLEEHSQGIGLSTHPLTNGDGTLSLALATQLKEGYLLIQDTFEHTVSHYMYAFGALGMSWCEIIAYSGQVLPKGVNLARVGHGKSNGPFSASGKAQSSKRLVVLWAVAGLLYGGIVAGVACQYPKGLYVGPVYVVLLFLAVSASILASRKGGYFSLGRHYILQTYLIGMVVAAVAIVAYMAIHHFDMLTSNDKSHLDSINRP
ncbi:hypothetical protein EMPS_07993 [Entomortierella parvispora]|uniref:Uncharacterized protein n=1 Tax=Entomortierella parvispora TaxID=205924 RepID=A0A9P3HFI7_9FUNG|nr:hypothetical protein EMPS_07993 [Entomortierella parvispora]